MRRHLPVGSAGVLVALIVGSASADFVVDLGSGALAGGETRSVEIVVDESMIPIGYEMVGFEFSIDFVSNGTPSWASDCAFWIEDANGNPSLQFGGWNVLFADIEGPPWPYQTGGSPFTGNYTAEFDHIRNGNGVWRFSIGNGWATSAPAQYNNVTATIIVGPAGACGFAKSPCDVADKSPGCKDLICCDNVCQMDPTCCEVAWDQFCVEVAIKICNIYQYECPPGGPANNCPTNPTPIAAGQSIPFDTTGADPVGPRSTCESDMSLGPDLWFQFCAPADGSAIFSSCGQADYDQKMRAYDVGDGNYDPNDLLSFEVGCGDDTCNVQGGPARMVVSVEAGSCYLLGIGGYLGAVGTGTLSLEFLPALSCGDPGAGTCCEPSPFGLPYCEDGACCSAVCAVDPSCCEAAWDEACATTAYQVCPKACPELGNDECDGALPVADGTNAFSTFNATTGTVFPPAQDCPTFSTSLKKDRWYVYSATCDGVVTVSTCPEDGGSATFDTMMAIWVGDDCGSMAIVGCNDDTCYLRSAVQFEAVCGATYFIQLGSYSSGVGFSGVGEISIACDGGTPCETPGNPADLDGDGIVGGADLAILLSAWGDCGNCAGCVADLTGDCTVGGADLSVLLSAWGS